MNNKTRKIIIVVGKTGYGKSYLVENEILPLLDRVVIFDLQGEYDMPGFIYITDLDSLQSYLIENVDTPGIKINCRFTEMYEYETAFEMCYYAENITVVIEEISNFANPSYMTPRLEEITRFGRHKSISIVGVTQRIGDVGPLLLNNADLLIVFNLTDRNDIGRLRSISYVGDDADAVARLERYRCLSFVNS
jgi:DNA helicase HerA-like ATPase